MVGMRTGMLELLWLWEEEYGVLEHLRERES